MNRRKLLARLAVGALQNVAFRDIDQLAKGFGFTLERQRGSHRIYVHPRISEQLNLQDVGGTAKPYQIRQLLRLVERYDLRLEDE
ncbi:MAG: type II toxin-antitoxin system HicA family toxin [Vicinamibacterales bacterium]